MVRTYTYRRLVIMICLLCDDGAVILNCIVLLDSLIYHAHILFGLFFSLRFDHYRTSVLNSCRSNSLINVTSMTMDNNISTTIIHQAITSKGDTEKRAIVVQEILAVTPHAAQIRNGYGSLPLHVISQRNTKMDSATKEILIMKLMDAYPMALTQPGGVGRRTPLHIIFTGSFFVLFKA
jgi:hypothetical protein